MQVPHLAQFAPLHKGRSFICYRDVNKAIERHRELYGLRLMLKKAIKLENYCLTVDQMRDLNFRLKYGELDYQCSVDNGRPGRPGKDERCPRLVRLRLSPDARTLVVYDTHIHEPVFNSPSQVQVMSPPYVLQGLLPEIPFKGLPTPSPTTGSPCPTTPTTPVESSSTKSSPGTPSSSSGYEKITVKLKKSQFSPNEMVVVGSARDAQEQFELRNTPEKSIPPPIRETPKYSDKSEPAYLARKLVEKLQQENTSTTVVYKSVSKSPPHVVPDVQIIPKPISKIAPKPQGSMQSVPSSSSEKTLPVKVPEKDLKIEKKVQQKPVIVNVPQKILPKPVKPVEKVNEKPGPKPLPKLAPKPVERSAKLPDKPSTKPSDKVVGKTVEKNGTKGAPGKTPVRLSQRCLDKNAQKTTSGVARQDIQRNGTATYTSSRDPMYNYSGSEPKTGPNGKRMYKKKKTRQSEAALDFTSLVPLDTELELNEKQQLAHGVLLKLMRVTSQLPMVEFTHALDTLEMLTDAYRLEQRVNLTISQDEEKEDEMKSLDNDYYEEYYNFDENDISSIGGEHRIALAQVDGSIDDTYVDLGETSLYSSQKRPFSFSQDHSENLQQDQKIQRLSL